MPLNSNAISNLIDTTKTLISEAATRQELLSGTTGQFEDQISGLKSFIFERISWISGAGSPDHRITCETRIVFALSRPSRR